MPTSPSALTELYAMFHVGVSMGATYSREVEDGTVTENAEHDVLRSL